MEPTTPPLRPVCTPTTPESPSSSKLDLESYFDTEANDSSIRYTGLPSAEVSCNGLPPTPAKTPKKRLFPSLLRERNSQALPLIEEDADNNPFLGPPASDELIAKRKRELETPPSDGLFYVFRGKKVKKMFTEGTDLSSLKPRRLFPEAASSSTTTSFARTMEPSQQPHIGVLPPDCNREQKSLYGSSSLFGATSPPLRNRGSHPPASHTSSFYNGSTHRLPR
ncbi:CDK inhibitor Rum1 [Schizosaccharomyces octosporus yFS286]|uniref:CDK inhibitor Rum1 n=1 Tax=Schizosaccharomyces octosporus (strain yFS286) TaxID=483514 RepID=S9QVU2_SCHOY|nr:CDK inhibitor Rum1 [Schizosaccharomyces octosporus yFS286]EPX70455.1 CDK inhibitor Rum1 [Schizosaccharomyces octosporus yFS286]